MYADIHTYMCIVHAYICFFMCPMKCTFEIIPVEFAGLKILIDTFVALKMNESSRLDFNYIRKI